MEARREARIGSGTRKAGWGNAGRDAVGQGQRILQLAPPPAGPSPHPHPAWPLAVNTERTSSVSWEIFISGRVGSVCWPLLVLPVDWPGAGGEGVGSCWGQSVGPGRQGRKGVP